MEQRPIRQEVDLLRLLAKTYHIIKTNLILVIVCPGLGLLLGFLYIQFSTKPQLTNSVAQSTLMIATDMLSENEAIFLCNDLIATDSLPGLTKMQNESVVNLSYDVKKEQTRDKPQVFIKLTATITHHYVLRPLQDALITYFNQTEPVLRQRKAKEKLYKAMIKKLDEEIAGMESMKQSKEKNAMLYNPYTGSAELYEKRINFQNALESNSVYVVKGFGAAANVAAVSVSSPKLPYLILGFLAGVIIVALILFIRFFNHYYRAIKQELE